MRHLERATLSLLLGLASYACGKSDAPRNSSTSHWVACSSDVQCEAIDTALACEDGYCVDASGERIEANSKAADDEADSEANSTASSEATPGNDGGAEGDDGVQDEDVPPSSTTPMPSVSDPQLNTGGNASATPGGGAGGSSEVEPDPSGAGGSGDGGSGALGSGGSDAGASGAAGNGTMAGECAMELPDTFPGCVCFDEADCDGTSHCYQADCEGGAVGTCAEPMEGVCWDDRDCVEGEICVAGSLAPCGTTIPDSMGSCTVAECGDTGTACGHRELCVRSESGAVEIEVSWQCVENPCWNALTELSCDCAGSICGDAECVLRPDGSGGTSEANPARPHDYDLACLSLQRCASPETPIATPSGDRAIAELAVGDLVYSVEDEQIRAVPIVRVNRVRVVNHSVMELSFEGGARFRMSAGHPTASGRTLGELSVGDSVEGAIVERMDVVPYRHSHTYDILPATESGVYFADGVLVGSTLKR